MKRDPSGYWTQLGIKGGAGSGEVEGHPFRGNQYTEGRAAAAWEDCKGKPKDTEQAEAQARILLGDKKPTPSTHGYLWDSVDHMKFNAIASRAEAIGFRKVSSHGHHGEGRIVYRDRSGNTLTMFQDTNTGTFGDVHYSAVYTPTGWGSFKEDYDTLIETPHEVGVDMKPRRGSSDMQAH